MEISESTHITIITFIDSQWRDGRPFAIHEIVKGTSVSTSSVIRSLKFLIAIRLIKKQSKGFQGRHYQVNHTWVGTTRQLIDAFEFAKVMRQAS